MVPGWRPGGRPPPARRAPAARGCRSPRRPIPGPAPHGRRRDRLRGRGWRAPSVALATASGLRSSCATKLAKRDRRRRSSTSLPTSRSSRTAPPSGRGVPSTSTSRSRPDIGSRTSTRCCRGPGSCPQLWPLVARQRPSPFVARLGDARPLVQRPVVEAPPEDAQGGVVGEGAQPIRPVDDQRLRDRLRHLDQPRPLAIDLLQGVAHLQPGRIGRQPGLVGAVPPRHCWPAGRRDPPAAATRTGGPARSPPASRRRRP